MIYIGKINKETFNNYIKPAYINYKNINYDLNKAKELIIYYIRLYYKNYNIDLSVNPNLYKLNLSNNMFKINIKYNDNITFYLCIKSRKLYYL
jgi:hypothetical protein